MELFGTRGIHFLTNSRDIENGIETFFSAVESDLKIEISSLSNGMKSFGKISDISFYSSNTTDIKIVKSIIRVFKDQW